MSALSANYLMILIFVIGYLMITIEHVIRINKATIALLMAVLMWWVQFSYVGISHDENLKTLGEHVADISQVIFFLLGALAVVETINVHKGFQLISNAIQIHSKRKILWIVSLIAFFLSSILDNLTTTIVMVSLLAKLMEKGEDRLLIGGAVVIAANAGGAWTPIGDVTTTMLWIGGEISTLAIMKSLFIPSFVCLLAALVPLTFMLKGDIKPGEAMAKESIEPFGKWIFFLGLGALVFVPIFKITTGLPPYMGMLLGLGVLWLVTDILHAKYHERHDLTVPYVLTRIDLAGILFFLGILLAINALNARGLLKELAMFLNTHLGSDYLIAIGIGLASAVVDNVPLVAASMSMYDLTQYPIDHSFWKLIAYCAGTGGSILIIGSAAGVVFMGMEKVNFFWYLKRISLAALVGYFAGILAYVLI